MGWPVFSKLVREGRRVKMIWSVRRKGELLHLCFVMERSYSNGVTANSKPIRLS